MPLASPRTMPIVPSVTMNGTSRNPTTIAPFASPASVEIKTPALTASIGVSVGCSETSACGCPSAPATE